MSSKLHASMILALVLIFGGSFIAPASAQEPSQKTEVFQFESLTAEDIPQGRSQYLVYIEKMDTHQIVQMQLWNRTTRIIEKNGQPFIEIIQDWHTGDGKSSFEKRSLNRLSDFSPVRHYTKDSPSGKISAYYFDGQTIVGDPEVEGNSQSEFSAPMQAETLNWEIDMEIFAVLPLQKDAVFQMNFYHPGSQTLAQVYEYKVIGDEVLNSYLQQPIDTWMLEIQYAENASAIFWLEKETGKMVKMEEVFGAIKRYKVYLGVETGAPVIPQ